MIKHDFVERAVDPIAFFPNMFFEQSSFHHRIDVLFYRFLVEPSHPRDLLK